MSGSDTLMANVRQLPLFPTQPSSIDDLNGHSALRDTLALFQQHLIYEGKSEHTVRAFTADLQLLAEFTSEKAPIGRYTTETEVDRAAELLIRAAKPA